MESERNFDLQTLIKNIESGVKIIILLTFTILLIYNFNKLSALLNNVTQIKFSEFELQISPVLDQKNNPIPDIKFIGRSNMSPRATIMDFHPQDPEYIDLRAIDSIDFSSGFIGDASELYSIEKNSVFLNKGECVRIYASAKDLSSKLINSGKKCNKGPLISLEANKGYLKSKTGKGERLVIFDSDRKPVIDLNYWIVSQ